MPDFFGLDKINLPVTQLLKAYETAYTQSQLPDSSYTYENAADFVADYPTPSQLLQAAIEEPERVSKFIYETLTVRNLYGSTEIAPDVREVAAAARAPSLHLYAPSGKEHRLYTEIFALDDFYMKVCEYSETLETAKIASHYTELEKAVLAQQCIKLGLELEDTELQKLHQNIHSGSVMIKKSRKF